MWTRPSGSATWSASDSLLGMTFAAFQALPDWRQLMLKREASLF